MPFISVVVPTFNRSNYLCKTLDSLLMQDCPYHKYEIIIVDDGSTDDTEIVVKQYMANRDNVNYYKQGNRGPAAARNLGIKHAQGNVIAFTDDDCIPDKDWLARIAECFEENPNIVGIGGQVFTDETRVTPSSHYPVSGSLPITANAAYSTQVLNRVGGFDENFPYAYHEDSDLYYIVSQIGQIVFDPEIRVFHPPLERTLWDHVKDMRKYRSDLYLYHKHPKLYKERRGGRGPLYVLIVHTGIKHFIKALITQSKWIIRDPFVYARFATMLTLQRIHLLLLLPNFYIDYRRIQTNKQWRRNNST